MRLQLLSDLHLETEAFDPQPAPGAEALVLAGDIDSTWAGLGRFARWPVPVLLVAGNHEFDGREWNDAWPALRARAAASGIRLVEREAVELTGGDGRRIRLLATTRWADFDLYGEAQRGRAMRSAGYFMRLMQATRDGQPFDAEAMRAEALRCRAWLMDALAQSHDCAATVVVTHFGPSVASADPRFGLQPSTASFCNDDQALMAQADLWLHGHVHCCHDHTLTRSGRSPARVVCNARGLQDKSEGAGFDPLRVVEV
ncbi:MAG TPA: metallophosphoesterase [Burkholderiaceae bacterium]|nr:metallophosphoesterase [Burkholderiaceae bacterium]